MYCLAAFIVIVALWSTPSVQSVDCTDQDALKIEELKCFTQSGFSVDPNTTNTSYLCSNIEAIKLAVFCVMDITRTCLTSQRQDPAIVPDNQKMTDGLLYLCDHAADYDAECVARTLPAISSCVELKAGRSFKIITCTKFDIILDCTRQNLGVCPRRTKEIFTNFFMYTIPTACSGGALWTTPSVLALDCSDENARVSEIRKCFTQSGLSVDAHTVADVETAILSNTSDVCRHTEAFKSAVSCVMGFARNCLISMSEDPAILPDANKMTDGLVYLCDHIADFDAECYIGALPTIEKCAEGKAHAALSVSSDLSFKFIFCTAFDATLNCARQQLGVCPRRTKEIAVNFFTYVTPAACSGGTSAGGTSCVFLLLAALLAVICRY